MSRKGGRWFVSFLLDDQAVTPERHELPGTAVGIDRGVKAAAVTPDGEFYDRPFLTGGESVRFRRLQQRLARQKKGSARRRRTLHAMGRIMGRVSDRRTDVCARTAARVVQRGLARNLGPSTRVKRSSCARTPDVATPIMRM